MVLGMSITASDNGAVMDPLNNYWDCGRGQRRSLPSAPPEASLRPSGLNSRQLTASEWPESVRTLLPDATSQSLMV